MGETRAPQAPSQIGYGEAEVTAARLREMLPVEVAQFVDFSFVRSHLLYGEFVYRLVLRVIQEVGLETTLRTGEACARWRCEGVSSPSGPWCHSTGC